MPKGKTETKERGPADVVYRFEVTFESLHGVPPVEGGTYECKWKRGEKKANHGKFKNLTASSMGQIMMSKTVVFNSTIQKRKGGYRKKLLEFSVKQYIVTKGKQGKGKKLMSHKQDLSIYVGKPGQPQRGIWKGKSGLSIMVSITCTPTEDSDELSNDATDVALSEMTLTERSNSSSDDEPDITMGSGPPTPANVSHSTLSVPTSSSSDTHLSPSASRHKSSTAVAPSQPAQAPVEPSSQLLQPKPCIVGGGRRVPADSPSPSPPMTAPTTTATRGGEEQRPREGVQKKEPAPENEDQTSLVVQHSQKDLTRVREDRTRQPQQPGGVDDTIIQSLQEQLEAAIKENDELLENSEKFQTELDAADAKIANLEIQLRTSEEGRKALKQKLKGQSAAATTTLTDDTRLAEELDTARLELLQVKNQASEFCQEIDQLTVTNRKLYQEIDTLKLQIRNDEVDSPSTAEKKLRSEHHQLQRALERTNEDMQDLNQRHQRDEVSWKEKLAKAQNEVMAKQKESDLLKTQFDEYKKTQAQQQQQQPLQIRAGSSVTRGNTITPNTLPTEQLYCESCIIDNSVLLSTHNYIGDIPLASFTLYMYITHWDGLAPANVHPSSHLNTFLANIIVAYYSKFVQHWIGDDNGHTALYEVAAMRYLMLLLYYSYQQPMKGNDILHDHSTKVLCDKLHRHKIGSSTNSLIFPARLEITRTLDMMQVILPPTPHNTAAPPSTAQLQHINQVHQRSQWKVCSRLAPLLGHYPVVGINNDNIVVLSTDTKPKMGIPTRMPMPSTTTTTTTAATTVNQSKSLRGKKAAKKKADAYSDSSDDSSSDSSDSDFVVTGSSIASQQQGQDSKQQRAGVDVVSLEALFTFMSKLVDVSILYITSLVVNTCKLLDGCCVECVFGSLLKKAGSGLSSPNVNELDGIIDILDNLHQQCVSTLLRGADEPHKHPKTRPSSTLGNTLNRMPSIRGTNGMGLTGSGRLVDEDEVTGVRRLVAVIFMPILTHMDSLLWNFLVEQPELHCMSAALHLKMSIANLEMWLQKNELKPCKAALIHIRDASTVLMLQKELLTQAKTRSEVCASLNNAQILKILVHYKPDELDQTGVAPNVIEFLKTSMQPGAYHAVALPTLCEKLAGDEGVEELYSSLRNAILDVDDEVHAEDSQFTLPQQLQTLSKHYPRLKV